MSPQINPIAVVLEYREVYDRPADLEGLISLVRDLQPEDSVRLLCQMNADFRLTKREKEAIAKTQQEIAGGLLSDETIARMKARFGKEHLADRPVFHSAQILNVIRLVVEHSNGTRSPLTDESARYALGTACLMMTDLMVSDDERRAVKANDNESVSGALMTQMLGPFEVQNTATIPHAVYRSRILFRELLGKQPILDRIKKQYNGFDFEREFLGITGIPLDRWIVLVEMFHAFLSHYLDENRVRHNEFLCIDRLEFPKGSTIPQADLDAALWTLSTTPGEFRNALKEGGTADWRFDSVPFRSRPLIELHPGKYYCSDLGLLAEKIHSGVFWAIHDGLSKADRYMLSGSWGILFEEYVNWFLSERSFKDFSFWSAPTWAAGGECLDGAFLKDNVFIPMEYKGGFLLRGAKYSGDRGLLEAELETKIVKGCKQLARKIEALFHYRPEHRKNLAKLPLHHVTRIVPLLVVQDSVLGAPLVNWKLNNCFNEVLDRALLRADVRVDSLNVVGIRELETMAESAEAGTFDLFAGLQLRCYSDPEMRSNLHNFLMSRPGYGEGRSARIKALVDQQLRETKEYAFGSKAQTAS
jgi:hypothetical protein